MKSKAFYQLFTNPFTSNTPFTNPKHQFPFQRPNTEEFAATHQRDVQLAEGAAEVAGLERAGDVYVLIVADLFEPEIGVAAVLERAGAGGPGRGRRQPQEGQDAVENEVLQEDKAQVLVSGWAASKTKQKRRRSSRRDKERGIGGVMGLKSTNLSRPKQ